MIVGLGTVLKAHECRATKEQIKQSLMTERHEWRSSSFNAIGSCAVSDQRNQRSACTVHRQRSQPVCASAEEFGGGGGGVARRRDRTGASGDSADCFLPPYNIRATPACRFLLGFL